MREPCLVVVVQINSARRWGTLQPPAANAGDVITLRQLNMLHHAAHGGLHVSSSFWSNWAEGPSSVNVGLSAGDASQAPLAVEFTVRLGRVFHNKCLLSPPRGRR